MASITPVQFIPRRVKMAFSSIEIANQFVDLSLRDGVDDLTPMKIQKLVFYAHGWHWAIFDSPLIDEQVEAWEYGPVIPRLYSNLREYGNQPITEHLRTVNFGSDFDWSKFEWIEPGIGCQENATADEKSNAIALTEAVWKKFKGYSAIQLSNMTHMLGTPWAETVSETKQLNAGILPKGTDIPADRIRKYFKSIMVKGSASEHREEAHT